MSAAFCEGVKLLEIKNDGGGVYSYLFMNIFFWRRGRAEFFEWILTTKTLRIIQCCLLMILPNNGDCHIITTRNEPTASQAQMGCDNDERLVTH
jgi:hypothetical protein